MAASGFILVTVLLNTATAAVQITDVPDTPLFQTLLSCEEYARLKIINNTVCFSQSDSVIAVGSNWEPPLRADRFNISVSIGKWGRK